MIPNGWSSQTIKSLCSEIIDCEHKTAPYIDKSDYFVATTNTIKNGELLLSKLKCTTKEAFDEWTQRSVPSVGDIIFTREAPAGETCHVPKNLMVCMGQRMVLLRADKKKVVPVYLSNYLVSSHAKYNIYRLSIGTTVSRINIHDIKKINCLVPPLPEQTKIANILSTWDKAIKTVKKLIENSRAQKNSLMQQLLTGKKRLLGFNDEWSEFVLGDLGKTYNGLTGKTKTDFGKGKPYIPYINIFNNKHINTDKLEYVEIKQNENQSKAKYGDIFFTTSSETPKEVGMSSVLLEKVNDLYLNSFCFGFRLHNFNTLLPEYACYFLRSHNLRREIVRLAQGSTRYNLSKLGLMKIKLVLPKIEEQKRISTILRIADFEIDNLKKKLDYLKQEKKALMQQLLTGKRRVKVA